MEHHGCAPLRNQHSGKLPEIFQPVTEHVRKVRKHCQFWRRVFWRGSQWRFGIVDQDAALLTGEFSGRVRANPLSTLRFRMTGDQTRFYLREIHPFWTTSHISADKVRELQRDNLVEISPDAANVVRLTREGARAKLAGRPSVPSKPMTPVRYQRRAEKKRTYVPALGLA